MSLSSRASLDRDHLLTIHTLFLEVKFVEARRVVVFFVDLPLSSVCLVLVRTGSMSLDSGFLGFNSFNNAVEAFLESIGRFLGKFSTGLLLGSMVPGTAVYPTFSGRPGDEPRSILGILGFVMAFARSGSYDPGPMVSSSILGLKTPIVKLGWTSTPNL